MKYNPTAMTHEEYVAVLCTLELLQLYHSFRERFDESSVRWADLARRRLVELHGAGFVRDLDRNVPAEPPPGLPRCDAA